MGSIGSWLVGSRHQNVFAGIIPISALPPAEVVVMGCVIPLYVAHNRMDESLAFTEVKRVITTLQQQCVAINWRP